MEGPRGVKAEEFKEAVGLINMVFRESSGLAPTIQYEFPTLLNCGNCENMRAIFDNGQPVAVLSFYKTRISLPGCIFNAACVGAVTTHPDYRRMGLASALLKDGENKMIADGIDLIIISGNNSVYTKQDYNSVVRQVGFNLKKGNHRQSKAEPNIYDINKDNFHKMVKMYAYEPTRFLRSLDDHRLLYEGALFEWGGRKYKAVLVEKDNVICGYLIIRMKQGENYGELVEYGGNREAVFDGLQSLLYTLGLEEIHGCIVPADTGMLQFLAENHVKTEESISAHTIKIVNFIHLMNKLKGYFEQFIDKKALESLQFGYDEDSYFIRLGDEVFKTGDIKEVNELLFGHGKDNIGWNEKIPGLKGFFDAVMPVYLPYFKGLNFI